MKTITYCIALVMWVLAMTLCYAQETKNIEKTITKELLESRKETIIENEKKALKKAIEAINMQVDKEEITFTAGEDLKKAAAEKHALNIENKLAIVDNNIALLERNGVVEANTKVDFRIFQDGETFNIQIDGIDIERKYDRRTTSDLVFAFGLNNVITKGQSLNDSPFKVGGSRFAELGIAWKTRVFKESNWLRVKYGFSFQWNGLKPIDNQFFVDSGNETVLEEFPLELDKSKFRLDNLVFPVHFEFGASDKIEKEKYFRYNTHKKIKVGLGGYAGFKLGSRQKLKFSRDGERVKEKLKADYNTNNFVYGVSAYIGWHGTALYAKYDLNPIFKDNPVEQRNVSLGLRFDMD